MNAPKVNRNKEPEAYRKDSRPSLAAADPALPRWSPWPVHQLHHSVQGLPYVAEDTHTPADASWVVFLGPQLRGATCIGPQHKYPADPLFVTFVGKVGRCQSMKELALDDSHGRDVGSVNGKQLQGKKGPR